MSGPRGWAVGAAVVALLAVGAGVAYGVGTGLGLSAEPAAVPAEKAVAAPPAAMVAAPEIGAVVVPDEPPLRVATAAEPAPGQRRVRVAAEAVAAALVARGRPRPAIGSAARGPGTRLEVRVGSGPAGESFVLDGGDRITIRAGTYAGAANGLYAVADRIRTGAPVVQQPGTVVTPRLPLRLTDAGSVGREPDPAAFARGTDYSLNSDVVGPALLPRAPWVDPTAVRRIDAEFRRFVEHALGQGYNGVVVPGFLEYVTFDGQGVYPDGDEHVQRARAMRVAFGPVFRYAADLGMRVYLLTDMLAVTPPLERRTAGLSTEDPALWAVYRAGLDELYAAMPFVSGLMVRVGEGGDVYRQAGWDISSKIAVTTPRAVQEMLRAFLAAGRDVVFRTWTVGVGAVGDLHTNPRSYAEVLGPISDPRLIVSTKYTLGDFYSHLPLNDTLEVGDHRRIVEFQARREFEGFGALPNDLTVLHRQALQRFLARNPHVEGVWTWTQDGGPLRAGPMSLYLKSGFWQLYDLNVYATARLAWDPDTDPAAITRDWVRSTFSADPRTVAAIGQVLALSRQAVTTGLYVRPYADQRVRALGLEPPPMMWIFEWDILTGDSAALDVVYTLSKDRLDQAIRDGDRAVTTARRMRATLAATDPATWRDPAARERFTKALDYQVSLFEVLGAYRTTVLRHAQWLDTGEGRAPWEAAEQRYRAARAEHERRYAGDPYLPAYNLTAADLGLARADRDPAMALLACGLLALLVGSAMAARRVPALRDLWLGAVTPWRRPAAPSRVDRVLVLAVPAAVLVASRGIFTWFAAPAHLLVTLGAWLLFAATARVLLRGRDPYALWAVIGGVAILRSVLLLAVLSVRGPGHLWLRFWTAETPRTAYVTVAVAAFGWLFVATAFVLRHHYGLRRRRAVGVPLAAAGVPLTVLSGLVGVVGLERALTAWNDQLALLPWGLSRILGITVYLGIPTSLPVVTAAAGAVLVALAGVLSVGRARPDGDRPGGPARVRASGRAS